jgi:hypothetical protein
LREVHELHPTALTRHFCPASRWSAARVAQAAGWQRAVREEQLHTANSEVVQTLGFSLAAARVLAK